MYVLLCEETLLCEGFIVVIVSIDSSSWDLFQHSLGERQDDILDGWKEMLRPKENTKQPKNDVSQLLQRPAFTETHADSGHTLMQPCLPAVPLDSEMKI